MPIVADSASAASLSASADGHSPPVSRGAVAGWFAAGLAFVAGAIAFVESLNPYYFCQDDALVLELPLTLAYLRATWQGQPFDYIPDVVLGSPVPSILGFYPPLHLAYAIARGLLGDEYATFDVSATLHLLAGYCLTFLLGRRLGLRPLLAALVGLTFVLSGPVIVMTRCWSSFATLPVFIPALALFTDRLRRGPVGWPWAVALGAVIGVYYHAGFPQIFVLGCGIMLVHAAALAAWGLVPWRRLTWFVPALLLGAAIMLPLFHRQCQLLREVTIHDAGGGTGLENNLLSVVLPYPLVEGTLPNFWGNVNPQWGGHFWYFGTVLLGGCAVAFVRAVKRRLVPAAGDTSPDDGDAESTIIPALLVPAVISLLLALGAWGGLWWLMGLLPVGLRNNPFRAMPWFTFFSCLAGGAFFEAFASAAATFSGPGAEVRRRRFVATIATAGVLLMALHTTRVGIAFYTYGFRPFPELPPRLAAVVAADDPGVGHRIMAFATTRSTDPSYAFALPHNLPACYRVPAFFGYDPLVQRFGRYIACANRVVENPRAALAAYGVRWAVVHRTVWGGWRPETANRFERHIPFAEALKPLLDGGLREVDLGAEESEFVRVLEIPEAAPLAFDAAAPTEPVPLRASTAGLDVELAPAATPRKIVVNFLRYPALSATADGQPVPVTEDEWQRIVVEAPAGTRSLAIRYEPDRTTGRILAAVIAACGLATLAMARRLAA